MFKHLTRQVSISGHSAESPAPADRVFKPRILLACCHIEVRPYTDRIAEVSACSLTAKQTFSVTASDTDPRPHPQIIKDRLI